MLTPQEVADHAFMKVTFGGYNMAAVDEFLDELTDDYTALYKENAALKAKMKVLVDKVEEYRSTEDLMRSALLEAQKRATSMVTEAEERKETLLADAEMEARARIGALHDEILDEQKRLNAIKAATKDFMETTRKVANAQLRLLDQLPDMTPEMIEENGGKSDGTKSITADITALGEKIVASYKQKYTEPAAEEEEQEQTKTVPVPTPAPAQTPKKGAEKTSLFPPVKIYEPLKPVEPKTEAPKSGTGMETRSIKLSDLKFGPNYRADQDE